MNPKTLMDYRVNFKENGQIISIEIKCCGRHIGELRFRSGEVKTCPQCNTRHELRMDHNHFHLSRYSINEHSGGEAVGE